MTGGAKNMDLVSSKVDWWNFFIAGFIAIGVFVASYAYADAAMVKHDLQAAFIFTFYFLTCIYAGRYSSRLWVSNDGSVAKTVLTTTAATAAVSGVLVFIMAQLTNSFNMTFLRILFVGIPFTAMSLSLGLLIKLVRTSIKNQLLTAKAAAEQSQGELRFLQNQLSPHFLFNTLNNMYGLSLTQHEKVPGLLLKLSDLLRYSVYDAKELFVPLNNELSYIKDYIDFEKIRIGDKLELDVSFEDIDPSVKIAPLLLIVFIENAFKHSKNTAGDKIYIQIILKTWASSILFTVKNTCGDHGTENNLLKKDSGFGLATVMKRLEFLYKGNYELVTEEKNGYYHVMLQLKSK
jgi:sensor histidine kinase YesM